VAQVINSNLCIPMPDTKPFVREAGSGTAVVCMHANASSSTQWRAFMDLLAPRYRVIAPDLYGSGKSPDWPSANEISLADELEFIAPVLQQAGDRFSLVGHSYGGAVALLAGLQDPGRIRALVLYEPTLFAIVDAQTPPPNGADGIRNAVNAASASLDAGDTDTAAMHFIDFWMGSGSWAATPQARKPAIAESIVNVRRWAHALFSEPTSLARFAQLDVPVLYMLGSKSPESAHAVARLLIPVLPNVRVVEFPGLGHMAPVTHPDVVNAEIDKFFSAV
jgi:pimeloyl-ACP methyl ester carboxylesterase